MMEVVVIVTNVIMIMMIIVSIVMIMIIITTSALVRFLDPQEVRQGTCLRQHQLEALREWRKWALDSSLTPLSPSSLLPRTFAWLILSHTFAPAKPHSLLTFVPGKSWRTLVSTCLQKSNAHSADNCSCKKIRSLSALSSLLSDLSSLPFFAPHHRQHQHQHPEILNDNLECVYDNLATALYADAAWWSIGGVYHFTRGHNISSSWSSSSPPSP